MNVVSVLTGVFLTQQSCDSGFSQCVVHRISTELVFSAISFTTCHEKVTVKMFDLTL